MGEVSITTMAGFVGLAIGLLFGALTHRTNFCTMGAIADAVSFEDYGRARAWLLAIGVAIVGAQALQLLGLVDLNASIYIGANLNWLGSVIGGLIFGFGMVLASGCPGRNLARVGGGDLKALIVLVIVGLVAYMTLRGITGPVRLAIENATSIDVSSLGFADHGMATLLGTLTGMSSGTAAIILTVVIALGVLWFCFKDEEFRASPNNIAAGLGIGLLITLAWWATGVGLADEFDPQPVVSLTFVAPTGNALQYLMTYTGATINFGIATVGGAILGAFLSAILSGRFVVTGFSDRADTVRHFAGAAMMGFGGVTALGCTIGQCITGMSTLALGSLIAALAIVVGGYFGMKYLERALGI